MEYLNIIFLLIPKTIICRGNLGIFEALPPISPPTPSQSPSLLIGLPGSILVSPQSSSLLKKRFSKTSVYLCITYKAPLHLGLTTSASFPLAVPWSGPRPPARSHYLQGSAHTVRSRFCPLYLRFASLGTTPSPANSHFEFKSHCKL